MKIYLSYRERMAGLFVLFAVLGVILFMVGAAVENRWFLPRVSYHTHVVHGDGLRKGSPVLLSGIEIGEVGEMTILPDNRIDVEILVLEEHVERLRAGTSAHIRRLLGIGEKRVHLESSDNVGTVLPAGALLPAREPMEILDMISTIDLGQYLSTLNRAVGAMEIILTKLEEEERLERMMEAFDQMGPTMVRMNYLLDEIDEPMIKLFKSKHLHRTFRGASRVFNDPNTRKMIKGMSMTFDPEKIDSLIARTESAITKFDKMLAEDGHLEGTLAATDKLLNDGRMDKVLGTMERLSDSKKLERLISDMSVLTHEFKKVAPEIPVLTKEMVTTLKEMVVVFKALQKTWILDDESEEAKKEIQESK